MAEKTPLPEPPNNAHVLVGEPPLQVLLIRDDGSAAAMRSLVPDLPVEDRWWPADSGDGDPLSWALILDPDPDPLVDGLPRGLNRKVMVRLFTPDELDHAVAQAYAAGGLRVIGEHLVEAAGWCRTCTSHHSEPEIARLEDRLAEEAGHGD